MLIFMAGLQGIPRTFYEAATIDGANKWKMFWKITFPLLNPTIVF
ncbi:ABC transporter permease subunit [Bacillus sp. N9]